MSTATAERSVAFVDPRFEARRRSVSRDRRRRRRRRTFTIAIVLVVVAAGWFVTRTALLDVDRIDVQAGVHTTAEDVLAASGVKPGDQLLDLDDAVVAGRVETLPWVATADVGHGIDGRVHIAVTERRPAATAVDDGGTVMLVDPDGRVLGPAPADDAEVAGLIPLLGVTAGEPGSTVEGASAVQIVDSIGPGVRSRVAAVAATPDGRLWLTLRPRGIVALGSSDGLADKLAQLTTVMGQVYQGCLAGIDVSDPSTPVVSRTEDCG